MKIRQNIVKLKEEEEYRITTLQEKFEVYIKFLIYNKFIFSYSNNKTDTLEALSVPLITNKRWNETFNIFYEKGYLNYYLKILKKFKKNLKNFKKIPKIFPKILIFLDLSRIVLNLMYF